LPHISHWAQAYLGEVTSLKITPCRAVRSEAENLPILRPLLGLDGDPLALADLRWAFGGLAAATPPGGGLEISTIL
jgi:hypothetical protein